MYQAEYAYKISSQEKPQALSLMNVPGCNIPHMLPQLTAGGIKHVFTGRGAKELYTWYSHTSPTRPFTLLIALWALSL